MPATRGPQGSPPRTFIFKLLHFKDRDMVLKKARAIQDLKFGSFVWFVHKSTNRSQFNQCISYWILHAEKVLQDGKNSVAVGGSLAAVGSLPTFSELGWINVYV